MHVTVRKGMADDAAQLARFRWHAESADDGPRRDAFVALFTAWFRDHLSTHVPFIAEVGNDVVGMAWLMVAERVPGPASRYRRCGDVQSVHVTPGLRGSGIGTPANAR